jgi:hypothetical protein
MNMITPNYFAVCLPIVGLIQTFSVTNVNAQSKADKLRAIERERLRSLVDADIATARRLHADNVVEGAILTRRRIWRLGVPRMGAWRNSSQDVSRLGCYSLSSALESFC